MNPIFDVSSVGLITEKGVFHPLNREKLTAFFS